MAEKNYQVEPNEFLSYFANFPPDPPDKREVCDRCQRPMVVCWCPYLPQPPLDIATNITILQHPFEDTRTLKTAPMLCHGLQEGKCQIIKGKRFNLQKLPLLQKVLSDPKTLLMYPGPKAQDLEEFVQSPEFSANPRAYNLLLLDGTWYQARAIFCQNEFLHSLKQVQLKNSGISEYVIRTQPTEISLSTLETAAIAISIIEHKPHIKDCLVRPLRAMCDFQIEHGAVKHHSKQYLVEHGLYTKRIPKAMRLLQEQAQNGDATQTTENTDTEPPTTDTEPQTTDTEPPTRDTELQADTDALITGMQKLGHQNSTDCKAIQKQVIEESNVRLLNTDGANSGDQVTVLENGLSLNENHL